MRNKIKSRILLVATATIVMTLLSSTSYSMESRDDYELCVEAYNAAKIKYVSLGVACALDDKSFHFDIPTERAPDTVSQNPVVKKYRTVLDDKGNTVTIEYWEKQNPNGMSDAQSKEVEAYAKHRANNPNELQSTSQFPDLKLRQ